MTSQLYARKSGAQAREPLVQPPPFRDHDEQYPIMMDDYSRDAIELQPVTNTTTTTTLGTMPPTYEDAIGTGEATAAHSGAFDLPSDSDFVPTLHLQVQTPGKALLGLPAPPRPDPIPILAVDPATGELGATPVFVSLRPARGSGNCYLVRGDDAAETPVCTTTYRFGPGRPPVMRLLGQPSSTTPSHAAASASTTTASASRPTFPSTSFSTLAADNESSGYSFEITSTSIVSRAQIMKTPYGTFTWRYADRKARKAASGGAGGVVSSLLVLDRVVSVATAGGGTEHRRVPVARLVRGDDTRSPGTRRSDAGNGGRLLVDLRAWADAKDDREQVLLIVVASCICMLKKEIDRRRAHQMIAISAAVSGGS
jgi:hypothetical protein